MRSIKTSFRYFLSTASFIFLFSSNIFSREHQNVLESIKDTLPSNDSLATKIFENPDVRATTDANLWIRFLQRGLQKIIVDAASSGIQNGTYQLDIRFVVERDGSISNAEAINNPLRGPKKVVERIKKDVEELIESGPRWAPAEVNGEKVRSYHTQPLTFMVSGL